MKTSKKPFSIRAFVSILMAFAFLGLATSGIILYLAPSCSVAERMGWTVIGLSKDQWSSMHMVAALFILVLALIHLFVYNWRTFMCYLRDRRSKLMAERENEQNPEGKWLRIPRELVAAIVVAIVMYAGAMTFIAPFGWLEEGREAIKEHYRKDDPGGQGRGRRAAEREAQSMLITPEIRIASGGGTVTGKVSKVFSPEGVVMADPSEKVKDRRAAVRTTERIRAGHDSKVRRIRRAGDRS